MHMVLFRSETENEQSVIIWSKNEKKEEWKNIGVLTKKGKVWCASPCVHEYLKLSASDTPLSCADISRLQRQITTLVG